MPTYKQLVNRHLTIAEHCLQQSIAAPNQLLTSGHLQSGLFHLHLVCIYYLREMAESLGLTNLGCIQNLEQLQTMADHQQIVINQCYELQQHQQWNLIQQLFATLYQPPMTTPLSGEASLQATNLTSGSLIASNISSDDDVGQQLSFDNLTKIHTAIQQLIESQRALAIEN